MVLLEEKLAQKDDEFAVLKESVSRLQGKTIALEFEVRKKNIILFKVSEIEGNEGTLVNGVSKLISDESTNAVLF